MPLYRDEDQSFTTDFGGGRSLSITLNPHAHSSELTRRWTSIHRQIQGVEKQIEHLRERQEVPGITMEEYERLQGEIEQWESKPSMISAIVELIKRTGEGWDNYASREAEKRGDALEFNAENIDKILPGRLIKIFMNLGRKLGLLEDEEKKASATKPESLQEPSTPEARDLTSTPTGIANSAPSET